MLFISHIAALLAGGAAGALLRPAIAKLFAPVMAKKALADAKALIAKAQTDATVLLNAQKLVAAEAAAKAAGATGATGGTGATAAAH